MYSSSLVITRSYLKKISVITTMNTLQRPVCYVLIRGYIQSDINWALKDIKTLERFKLCSVFLHYTVLTKTLATNSTNQIHNRS